MYIIIQFVKFFNKSTFILVHFFYLFAIICRKEKGELRMSTPVLITIIVLSCLIVGGLVAMLAYTFPIANRVYKQQLVRTSNKVWGHNCSAPDNEEQMAMWQEGLAWAESEKDYKKEVGIENDGFKLYGEYYDFGSDKCVIILPGRSECLKYSYFYAKPYRESGYNVLVIDMRCHGLSEGKYSSIGKNEHKDVIAWSNFLIKEFNIKTICLHCICVGSASGVLACTAKTCPPQIKELVVEGCFVTFRESFKQHMVALKKPTFPVCDEVMFLLFLHTGVNVYTTAPIKHVKNLKQRVLFLHGKQDIFSLPIKTEKLFAKCGAKDKRLVWFDKGAHSHLRINNHQSYDNAVKEFLNDVR